MPTVQSLRTFLGQSFMLLSPGNHQFVLSGHSLHLYHKEEVSAPEVVPSRTSACSKEGGTSMDGPGKNGSFHNRTSIRGLELVCLSLTSLRANL